MRTAQTTRIISAIIPLIPAAAAAAQTAPIGQPEDPADQQYYDTTPQTVSYADDRIGVQLSFRPNIRFNTGFENRPGEYSVASYPLELNFTYQASDRFQLAFGIEGEVASYDLENAPLVPGDTNPFDEVYRVNFSLGGVYSFDNGWTASVSGFFGSSWQEDADFGKGLLGGGIGVASYRVNDDLTIGGGVGVSTQIEDDPAVFPVIFLRWDINDRFTLATEGLGLNLSYTVSDEIKLFATGGFDRRQFVLDDEGPLPEGVIRDDAILIGGGVEYSPNQLPGLTMSLTGGAVIFQEFETRDRNGREIFEDETDPAPYLGAFLQYRF